MALIALTDLTGTDLPVTIDTAEVADTLRSWMPDPPDDVLGAIDDLRTALDRHQYTGDLETFLDIEIRIR